MGPREGEVERGEVFLRRESSRAGSTLKGSSKRAGETAPVLSASRTQKNP